jgi:[ribosomal protein S5]-alanine N-acetyltransferase
MGRVQQPSGFFTRPPVRCESVNVPPIVSERLDLVWLSPAFIDAALNGRRDEAETILGAPLPDHFPGEDEPFLRLRREDMQRDPAWAPWLMRALVLRHPKRAMVGHAGFHGPPDRRGVAEIGYTVFPEHRRQGYAEEAASALMDWARRDHDVRRFRASVSPTNEPSLQMVRKLGFRQIGHQIDEIDGLELVFELKR